MKRLSFTPALVLLTAIALDRKSTRLNSSHLVISYAVFCLKKKNLIVVAHGCCPARQAPQHLVGLTPHGFAESSITVARRGLIGARLLIQRNARVLASRLLT